MLASLFAAQMKSLLHFSCVVFGDFFEQDCSKNNYNDIHSRFASNERETISSFSRA